MEFPIHTNETAPEASRMTLEATAQKYGFVPNLIGVLAESPATVQAYVAINTALEQSILTPIEQQVVTITVSVVNGCTNCVGAHSTVAHMVGMSSGILEALRAQQVLPDAKLNALRVFAESLVQHRGWVPDTDAEQFLTAGYSRKHVLDTITIVAFKTLSNYVNYIAKAPLDPQFVAQAWQDKG